MNSATDFWGINGALDFWCLMFVMAVAFVIYVVSTSKVFKWYDKLRRKK